MDEDKILKVFARQTESRGDFRSACQSLGFWNNELEGKINVELDSQRLPLGHVLVRRKAIDIGKLTKALDEFLSTAELPSVAEAAAAAAPSESKIDELMLDEFQEFFSENKLGEFKNIVDLWSPTQGDAAGSAEFLKDMSARLHTLKGMATCVRLPSTQGLLAHAEQAVTAISSHDPIDANKAKMLQDSLSLLLNNLNLLREAVLADKTEQGFLSKNQEQINTIINQFGALKK